MKWFCLKFFSGQHGAGGGRSRVGAPVWPLRGGGVGDGGDTDLNLILFGSIYFVHVSKLSPVVKKSFLSIKTSRALPIKKHTSHILKKKKKYFLSQFSVTRPCQRVCQILNCQTSHFTNYWKIFSLKIHIEYQFGLAE